MNTPANDRLRVLTTLHRQQGAVTAIMAVLLLVVVVMAQQVALRSGGTGAASATLQSDGVEAMLLAESGLERAMYLFENGTTCAALAADGTKTLGNGSFTISASYSTDFDDAELDSNQCRVRVVGKAGNGNAARTLEGVFRTTTRSAWIVGDNGTLGLWDGTTVNAGATAWSTDQLNDVYCVTASDCWAVGENGDIIHWDGTAWGNVASGTGQDLNGVTCTASNNCWAVGDNGTILKWNGTTWASTSSSTSDDLNEVSCASSSLCFAVGEDRTIQKWNGSSWSSNYGGSSSYDFFGVYCIPGSGTCIVVGSADDGDGYIRRTTDSGGYWAYEYEGGDTLYDVTCSPQTTSKCVAVGRDGYIRKSTNSGDYWSSSDSNTDDDLRAVHCVNDSNCWAAGEDYTIRKGTVDGSSWSSSHSSSYSDDFYGIHCVATNDCWAVGAKGYSGYIERWNGSSWDDTTYNTTASSGHLYAVTCVGGKDCWTVGASGRVVHYDGDQWSDGSSGTSATLYAVACEPNNGSSCYAVGYNSVVRRWDGSNWSSRTSGLGTSDDLRAVSCPSSTCYVAEGEGGSYPDGDVYKWTGSTWTKTYTNTSYPIWAMDCYASGACRAVGAESYSSFHAWYTNNGTNWYRQDISEGSDNATDLRGVSCLAADNCWAVGDDQYSKYTLFKWNGSSWSKQFLSDASPRDMNAVHCGAADQCLAVGDSGQILLFEGSTWSEWGTYTTNNLNGVYMFPKTPPQLLEWREPSS